MWLFLATIIPANIFTYATTDMSYAEQVAPMMDVPELQLNNTQEQIEKDIEIVETTLVGQVDTVMDVPELQVVNYGLSRNRSIDIMDTNITEGLASLAGVTEDDTSYSVLLNEDSNEFSVLETQANNKMVALAMETIRVVEEEKSIQIIPVDQSEALIDTHCPDENYNGSIVKLSDDDRELLERLVMGEAGGEGMIGAALVAQAIRDTMIIKDIDSIEEVRRTMKYSGSTKKEPNESVKEAVAFIFDEGGIAVKHKIIYFYAPKLVKSSFHESQKFIVEHKGHRFFSSWE